MGRPRTPTKILDIRGASRKHPERRRERANEPDPVPGLGPPPDYFDEAERGRWAELRKIVPAGVLTRMDRPMAEQLCVLWVEFRRRKVSARERQLLAALFGKFGLSPSDRSRAPGPAPAKKPSKNRFRLLS